MTSRRRPNTSPHRKPRTMKTHPYRRHTGPPRSRRSSSQPQPRIDPPCTPHTRSPRRCRCPPDPRCMWCTLSVPRRRVCPCRKVSMPYPHRCQCPPDQPHNPCTPSSPRRSIGPRRTTHKPSLRCPSCCGRDRIAQLDTLCSSSIPTPRTDHSHTARTVSRDRHRRPARRTFAARRLSSA